VISENLDEKFSQYTLSHYSVLRSGGGERGK